MAPTQKVAMFIPCFVDQLAPRVGLDMATVLRRAGYAPEFPEEQTCCGQPAFNTGYWKEARAVAERFIRVFKSADLIVCPSGSCATMVRNFYPELLERTPLREEASSIGRRTFEFAEFLTKVAQRTDFGSYFPYRVAYHDACHALRELHLKNEPRDLLRKVRGLELVEIAYSETCCGFGGTFAMKFGMISGAMGDAKAINIEASNTQYVASTDPSCLMHIDGILRRRGSGIRTIHLASILAQSGDPAQSVPAQSSVPVEAPAAK